MTPSDRIPVLSVVRSSARQSPKLHIDTRDAHRFTDLAEAKTRVRIDTGIHEGQHRFLAYAKPNLGSGLLAKLRKLDALLFKARNERASCASLMNALTKKLDRIALPAGSQDSLKSHWETLHKALEELRDDANGRRSVDAGKLQGFLNAYSNLLNERDRFKATQLSASAMRELITGPKLYSSRVDASRSGGAWQAGTRFSWMDAVRSDGTPSVESSESAIETQSPDTSETYPADPDMASSEVGASNHTESLNLGKHVRGNSDEFRSLESSQKVAAPAAVPTKANLPRTLPADLDPAARAFLLGGPGIRLY
ncbi:MAG: hypothetical protein EOO27_33645, partial [Comamonadaceae bacterium]